MKIHLQQQQIKYNVFGNKVYLGCFKDEEKSYLSTQVLFYNIFFRIYHRLILAYKKLKEFS